MNLISVIPRYLYFETLSFVIFTWKWRQSQSPKRSRHNLNHRLLSSPGNIFTLRFVTDFYKYM